MDESGFAIGASQFSRALINVREPSSWKVIQDCKERITAIECINAVGAAIPSSVIFKAKYTNTAWTLNSHGCEWLMSEDCRQHGCRWILWKKAQAQGEVYK